MQVVELAERHVAVVSEANGAPASHALLVAVDGAHDVVRMAADEVAVALGLAGVEGEAVGVAQKAKRVVDARPRMAREFDPTGLLAVEDARVRQTDKGVHIAARMAGARRMVMARRDVEESGLRLVGGLRVRRRHGLGVEDGHGLWLSHRLWLSRNRNLRLRPQTIRKERD